MEVAWLEDFLALSSTRVFAKAAEIRNISQSAFTRRIKNLEFWLGAPLFDRSVHPVRLTHAGEAFKVTAYQMINALEEARQEAKGIAKKDDEILEFHALHSLAISFFPQWLVKLERVFGTIRTRVVAEDFSGCIEAVLSGSSDFMLSFHHPAVPNLIDGKSYPFTKIATDTLIAVSSVTPNGSPRFRLSTKEPLALLGHPTDSFLGRITQMVLQRDENDFQTDVRYQNSIAEALKAACLQGLGVCWMPQLAVHHEIADGRLTKISGPAQETQLSIRIYRTAETGRPAVERFWSLCSSSG
ncbi:LysR substrate-binding domain-containing protein [Roseibium sp.]|uniref:LysR substrate-binding domain-containing protein n=1 Tax=Roseibium sp. TaxID=1936156 RepID=UPI003B5032A4